MSKRENDSYSIHDLMKEFIKENRLSKGMQKVKVEEAWHSLMGPGVSNYTEKVMFKNATLIVTLTSSVLREELSYGKEKIIKMINEEIGEDAVAKLMLV